MAVPVSNCSALAYYRSQRLVTRNFAPKFQNRPEYVLLLAGAADASCREQQNEFAGASRNESSVALI
jgi:hypothetical protein